MRKSARGIVFGVLGMFFAGLAQGQEGPEYLRLLGLAQKHLGERKVSELFAAGAGAAGAIGVLGLDRRFYSVGETWTVEFTSADSPLSRSSEHPEDLVPAVRAPARFDFKVVALEGEPKAARIEVRQRAGEAAADPRIDHEIIFVSERFVIIRKEIHFRSRPPLVLLNRGAGNQTLGFEAFPVELPDVTLARGETPREVPAELRGRAQVDAAHALEFRYSDLFARPVRAIWRDGDAWPVYVRLPSGTAILTSQEGRR